MSKTTREVTTKHGTRRVRENSARLAQREIEHEITTPRGGVFRIYTNTTTNERN